MQVQLNQPFSNAQIELLKVFSHDVKENEIVKLKELLATFFAERLMNEADKTWDANDWDTNKVRLILETKTRKLK
ncbi:MAG: hypothetical protein EAZ53_13220 [Bacteroidetes bacterium]|nr:MAG: hypothetical protein EAZ53_13220 [Bacteroidota bacterium]